MPLSNDIQSLKARTLSELVAAHDYYAETKAAWDIVAQTIQKGLQVSVRNEVTSSVATEVELAGRADMYIRGPLAQATFQQFVAIFESFFFDLLRLWLLQYPHSLANKDLKYRVVLGAPDKDAISLHVVTRELNEVAYERPREWFKYLEDKAKIGCPTEDEIERLSEAKASRDVLAHNRGVANKVYLAKAGKYARHQDGEPLDIPEPYHRQTWELVQKVVADVADAATAKAT